MKMNGFVARVWRIFSSVCAIALVASGIAWALMRSVSGEGPVVKVIDGPGDGLRRVPYMGALTYRLVTERMESCPGTSIVSFVHRDGTDAVAVNLSRPVSQIVMGHTDAHVTWMLPQTVHVGRWRFTSVIDSQCPLRRQQDITASFDVEVLPPDQK